jgi:hypothetical protein
MALKIGSATPAWCPGFCYWKLVVGYWLLVNNKQQTTNNKQQTTKEVKQRWVEH